MNQLFTMIILMLVGVILNKKKYLSENDAKELSVILVKVAVLANMIILLQRPYSHEIFVEFLKVCAGTLGVCFIATILFYVVGKWMKRLYPAQLCLLAVGHTAISFLWGSR